MKFTSVFILLADTTNSCRRMRLRFREMKRYRIYGVKERECGVIHSVAVFLGEVKDAGFGVPR